MRLQRADALLYVEWQESSTRNAREGTRPFVDIAPKILKVAEPLGDGAFL